MGDACEAVLLAAGRSSRMGRDKALLECDGQPMWRRQRDVLREAGATEVYLSARPEQTWAAHAEGFAAVLHDAMPDCGPLVGVTAGLERMSAPLLAVLAIDLPRIRAAWFHRVRAASRFGCGAVGRRADGFFEPLAAIYPRELKWLAWESLAGGHYSLQTLLAKAEAQGLIQPMPIAPADEPLFENWNSDPEPREGAELER